MLSWTVICRLYADAGKLLFQIGTNTGKIKSDACNAVSLTRLLTEADWRKILFRLIMVKKFVVGRAFGRVC